MRQEYITAFHKKWNNCLAEAEKNLKEYGGTADVTDVANSIFEESATADEVTGYYIVLHGDNAFKDWRNNIEGIILSAQDKEIDYNLEQLYTSGSNTRLNQAAV